MDDLDEQDIKALTIETDVMMHEILPDVCVDQFTDLKLDVQQIRWCYEYVLSGMDSSVAYRIAYSEPNGTKCRLRGNAMLKNKDVVICYNKIIDLLWESAQKTLPLMLLQQLQMGLTYTMSDFYDSNWNALPLDKIPKDKQALINNVIPNINNKTGEVLYTYSLRDRGGSIQAMTTLLKIKEQTRAIEGDGGDTQNEAREMRNRIFGSLNPPAAGVQTT